MAGQPRNIESPEQLYSIFEEYQKNLDIIRVPQSHVKLGIVYLEIPEPMSMQGFKSFCWDKDYGDIGRYIDGRLTTTEYVEIVTRIKDKIFKHNLSRAAAGLYKENLIARQLGMTEKTENKNNNTHTGKVQIELVKSDIPLANNEKDIDV